MNHCSHCHGSMEMCPSVRNLGVQCDSNASSLAAMPVPQLTSFCHTGSLENFHSVLLKWAPKRIHFGYAAMRARVQLACLSHNTNVGRAHATTSAGVLRYRCEFTKSAKHWVAKRIHEPTSYAFLTDLLRDVHEAVLSQRAGTVPACVVKCSVPVLTKNIATTEAPAKEDLVTHHMSRMSH